MSAAAVNPAAISAVARRQLWSLLGNPLGYVFIFAFVVISGATLFLPDALYQRNISSLWPLFNWMPAFLAVLLPALAMGAWASERDSGTEELLLTLPLSVADAVVGKYLAILGYFAVALLCSLSNVAVLGWLGVPDAGLIIANYVGWFAAGAVFGAFGLLASTLVTMPAVAFVIGIIFSGIVLWGFQIADYFDAFNRGVLPIGNLLVAGALVLAALAIAILLLSSRRWKPGSSKVVVGQVISLTFGLLLCANLARIGGKHGADADVTSEGLASISQVSRDALANIPTKVTVTAFVSEDLPADLAPKGKEVIEKVKALERANPTRIETVILQPKDALDDAGAKATREFGLKPRKVVNDAVTGREMTDAFLSAAVTSGGNTQVIEHFDPGLSVEYELVRAVRAVTAEKKPVLGVVKGDLNIMASMDYQSGQQSPEWEIVKEWKKQYEVREVNLDVAVGDDVQVLVVPQVSSFTQPQLENLHSYVWAGRPALLLEDPMPFFAMRMGKTELLPTEPKKSANPYGGEDAGAPKKGDVKPLWKALGIDFDPKQIAWSDYNPSHQYREMIPRNFVWTTKGQGGVKDLPMTTGIAAAMFPYPGTIYAAVDKPSTITVSGLVIPVPGVTWGRSSLDDLTERNYMARGALMPKDPSTVNYKVASDRSQLPVLVAEITGTMKAAYPVEVPGSVSAAGSSTAAAEKKTGVDSPKPIHVVVISDVDFITNDFFYFYRNADKRIQDELPELLSLRNVQLAANAVDTLFNDSGFLTLRSSRAVPRPLKKLEDQMLKAQELLRQSLEAAQTAAKKSEEEANAEFQKQISAIDERQDLDQNAKEHEKAKVQILAQRNLDLKLQTVKEQQELAVRDAKLKQRRAIEADRSAVKWLAIGIPAAVLAILVLFVYINKLMRERAHIPSSRKRA